MNKLKLACIVGISVPLLGCFESRKNTEQLCQANPALQCQELNMNDGQCRLPRTDLIWHRFETLKNPSESNKIKEFHFLAAYEKCMHLAAQIETLTQSERKTKRVTAVVHAKDEQQRLITELQGSRSPQALYFLWSQTGDENARRLFLQMEGSPELETAEMQYALATFYTRRDSEKTLALLNRTLELGSRDNINVDAVKSLASLNLQQGHKELAYIWSQVAEKLAVQTTAEHNYALIYGFSDEKYQQLDQVASNVYQALQEGRFRVSMTALPTM
ncbi:hypothetical protein BIY21_17630 [Vibrio ponticus]|uniref:DUF2989 domain-containing protein n=1 Tax=Vibrio ponticus TaxID=265668 RepID=A0ABX3F8H1_9VIBR|nr:DUF2989 domain-containing protein [Vibrio ponticus]OLQ86873.1 hypothetical protein BIY21_17630 [Vibrio ponticus]